LCTPKVNRDYDSKTSPFNRYNPQEGILYRGDGSNVFLRERPRLIFDLMGDGKRRAVDCDDASCHVGPVEEQRLLSPVALAAASDGSVYVGDYNLIRRIRPDRVVTTVLKLKSSGMAYRYHLSVNSHDDVLYVSDPESHRVVRVKNVDDPADIENNFEVGKLLRESCREMRQCLAKLGAS